MLDPAEENSDAETAEAMTDRDEVNELMREHEEILGVQSHIYLWTHAGVQQKAEVGLSKVNPQEATMACALAR